LIIDASEGGLFRRFRDGFRYDSEALRIIRRETPISALKIPEIWLKLS
jgi:hypothetical protein